MNLPKEGCDVYFVWEYSSLESRVKTQNEMAVMPPVFYCSPVDQYIFLVFTMFWSIMCQHINADLCALHNAIVAELFNSVYSFKLLSLTDSTQKPGPGAHYPERVYINKRSPPKFSMGIRHSDYTTPLIVEVTE